MDTGPEAHPRTSSVAADDNPAAGGAKLVDALSQHLHDLWHNVWGQGGLGNRERRGDRDLALDQFLEQLVRPAAQQVARINGSSSLTPESSSSWRSVKVPQWPATISRFA
jgi:hypothetical protein